MYKALIRFNDDVNGGIYDKGDIYPRDGVKPAKSRIRYLATDENKTKAPVIELVKDVKNNAELPHILYEENQE